MPPKKPGKDIFTAIERLLKVRPRSVGELRQRLLRKGFDRETVDTLLEDFEARGVLNDQKFASWWIEQRTVAKPTGTFGLAAELRQKNVDKTTIQAAITASGVKTVELELAKSALEPRLARYEKLDPLKRKRRVAGFLARRGFSSGVISEIISTL